MGSRMGSPSSLPRDKAPRHEADHSPPYITAVKMSGATSPLPLCHGMHRGTLSLYLEGQTDNNVGKKQTIIFGHINVTVFFTTIQSIKDEQ